MAVKVQGVDADGDRVAHDEPAGQRLTHPRHELHPRRIVQRHQNLARTGRVSHLDFLVHDHAGHRRSDRRVGQDGVGFLELLRGPIEFGLGRFESGRCAILLDLRGHVLLGQLPDPVELRLCLVAAGPGGVDARGGLIATRLQRGGVQFDDDLVL